MESINLIKGYDKVNSPEGDPNPKHHRRRIAAITAATVLIIVIVSLIGTFICSSTTKSGKSEKTTLDAANSAVKTVCSVTIYPETCISTISPLNTPPSNNPLHLFNISLQATMNQVSNLSALPVTFFDDPKGAAALKDCVDLFAEATSQLEKSAESMRVKTGEKVLTQTRISDIQTWISAALTDQVTCLDGLEEMGSPALDDVSERVRKSKESMSNTLAILNNMQILCDKLGCKLE